ncbi:uncharacterized protein CIMG_04702 [Coccidioides immitis RS]|uniref:Uncharacterized protein n=1 Tax=Coccidioides immitis (strain RS) TaxID=246410 RepID=J3KE16_COCIM|nr:uncharacterized protein CIMG_04702 [Coccidioides immitis RS]EAS33678.3 hypothetical protein CIMG_04702 [Coccidioides immitis RS]TPX21340.1 hypothetical protein DIZ76_015296 [Coccidioides immitis]
MKINDAVDGKSYYRTKLKSDDTGYLSSTVRALKAGASHEISLEWRDDDSTDANWLSGNIIQLFVGYEDSRWNSVSLKWTARRSKQKLVLRFYCDGKREFSIDFDKVEVLGPGAQVCPISTASSVTPTPTSVTISTLSGITASSELSTSILVTSLREMRSTSSTIVTSSSASSTTTIGTTSELPSISSETTSMSRSMSEITSAARTDSNSSIAFETASSALSTAIASSAARGTFSTVSLAASASNTMTKTRSSAPAQPASSTAPETTASTAVPGTLLSLSTIAIGTEPLPLYLRQQQHLA